MKFILILLFLTSCNNQIEEIKYIPQEIIVNDTITKLINNKRTNNNLNKLKSEVLLTNLSKSKAIEMENHKQINHNGFQNLEINADSFAQIVGYGYSNEISLFKAYSNSEEHNKYMLGNFTHIGSYTYKSYNCVLFAKY